MSGEKPVPGRPAEANTTDFAGRTKDDGRSARLSFRNFAEHGMRREFKDKALQTCSSYVKAFAECAEEKGLLVVWSCRGAIGELYECMAEHNSHEAFAKYLEEHKDELEKKTIKSKA